MKQHILLFIFIAILFNGCKNHTDDQTSVANDYIRISKSAFEEGEMILAEQEQLVFDDVINVNGIVISEIDGIALLSAPVEGFVTSIFVVPGQNVVPGNTILEIGGSAVIDLQKALAVSSIKHSQYKADYERARKLYEDNIITEKEYNTAVSNYKSELASFSALKMKVENIGLSVSDCEKGAFASSYVVTAAIAGQLTSLNVVRGQFVNTEQEIGEIVNPEKTSIKLSVFEHDFRSIEKGQKVVFSMGNHEDVTATISHISKVLEYSTKSFNCYANVPHENTGYFAVNQIVEGAIVIDTDSLFAVPQNAITSAGNNNYILTYDHEDDENYYFNKSLVSTDRVVDGFVEVINLPKGTKILVN